MTGCLAITYPGVTTARPHCAALCNGISVPQRRGAEPMAPPLYTSLCVVLLGGFAQRVQLTGAGQRGQRLLLELTDALGREAQATPGLTQRGRSLAVDAEAQLDDVALTLGEGGDGALHSLHARALRDFLGRLGAIVGQQIAKGGLAVLTDRLVEARHRARSAPDLDY